TERGITPAQLALAWVLHRGQHIVPIPGTKRVSYLEEHLAAAGVELSDADVEQIAAALPAAAGARYPEAVMRSAHVRARRRADARAGRPSGRGGAPAHHGGDARARHDGRGASLVPARGTGADDRGRARGALRRAGGGAVAGLAGGRAATGRAGPAAGPQARGRVALLARRVAGVARARRARRLARRR